MAIQVDEVMEEVINKKNQRDGLRLELQKHFTHFSNMVLWRVVLKYVLAKNDGEAVLSNLFDNWRRYTQKEIEQQYRDIEPPFVKDSFNLLGIKRLSKGEATAVLNELIAALDAELRPYLADETAVADEPQEETDD